MGDELAIFAGLLCSAVLLIVPIVAVIIAAQASRRVRELDQRINALESELFRLQSPPVPRSARPVAPAAEPPQPVEEPPPATEDKEEGPTIDGAAAPADAEAPPAENVQPAAEETPRPDAQTPQVVAEEVAAAEIDAGASSEVTTLEQRIALTWFSRIGAGVLLLGVAYGFKYAVDNQWIGPWGRVGIGTLVGVAVVVTASVMRLHPVFRQVLLGVGVAILSLGAYATYGFYHLVPVWAAFAAVAVVAGFGGVLAYVHRSQPILILALLTGLANPVLLSTGQDQALGLFAYLFLMTGVCFVAAVRLRFSASVWIAVAGTAALFAGWYARFYDIAPASADRRVEVMMGAAPALAGAYHDWTARLVPLGAVLLFGALWIGVRFIAIRAERDRPHLKVLPLVALSLMQLGVALLLPDEPIALGVGMSILAALSVPLLVRTRLTPAWTALPMSISFVGLLVSLGMERDGSELAAAAVATLWAAATGAGLVRRALSGEADARGARLVLLAVQPLFTALVAVALIPDQAPLYAAAVGVASLGILWLTLRLRWDGGVLLGVIFSALGLMVAGLGQARPAWTLLNLSGFWTLAHLCAFGYVLVVRRWPTSGLRLLALSVVAVGASALVLILTPAATPTLRALSLFVLASGLFFLGAAMVIRGGAGGVTGASQVMLGESLAACALALGLLYSGIEFSAAFLTLGAVTAAIAARTESRGWLAAAGIQLLIGTGHVLGHDVQQPTHAFEAFLSSRGATGALHPEVVTNPRAYGLVAAAAALLLAGWVLSRARWRASSRTPRLVGLGCAAIGHLLLLTMVVIEARAAATPWPPAPTIELAQVEFDAFLRLVAEVQEPAAAMLALLTTLVIGAYGAIVLTGGFIFRSAFHRYFGLATLVVTLGKLAISDIWNLTRGYQVVVLIAVGALLLGSGFLYARFGGRIVALLRNGSTSTGAAILLILFGAAAAVPTPAWANPVEVQRFRQLRPIEGVTGPGLYRLPIDPPLYRAAAPELRDLRVADGADKQVPFTTRPVATPTTWRGVLTTDAGPLDGGRTRATFDLGAPPQPHDVVQLDIHRRSGPYVRRVTVEVSDDRVEFVQIRRGAQVYDVGAGEAHQVVRYPRSLARYLRLTIEAGEGAAPEILGGRVAASGPRARPRAEIALTVETLRRVESEGRGEGNRTVVTLDAGAAGVPLSALRLGVSGGSFDRRVDVAATNYPEVFPRVASGWIFRGVDAWDGEALEIALPQTTKRYLQLTIYDGDDQPLEITGVTGIYHLEELVISTSGSGEHRAYLDARGRVAQPRFDLNRLLARAAAPTITPARWGEPRPNSTFTEEDRPAPAAWTERFRDPISVILAVAVLGLALSTLWLLRRGPSEPAQRQAEAVEDHGDARQGHGASGHGGVELGHEPGQGGDGGEDAGRQGDQGDVVEEGPEEVLPDRGHGES